MGTKKEQNVPQVFQDFATEATRFSEGVQLLTYSDGRGVKVSTEATRFAGLVGGTVERLAMSPLKDNGADSLDHLARDIAPAVQVLGHMVSAFRGDALSGVVALPDQNDLEIGLNLMEWAPDSVLRLVHLIAAEPWGKQSAQRTALVECLADAGVPREGSSLDGPGTIKILFIAILVLIVTVRPEMARTVIFVLIALFRIGDGAQDGSGKKYCPCPDDDDDDNGGDDDGDDGGGGKNKGGKVRCGSVFPIEAIGDAATVRDAIGEARRNAETLAALVCPGRCPPRLIFIGELKIIRRPDGSLRAQSTYTFRCT